MTWFAVGAIAKLALGIFFFGVLTIPVQAQLPFLPKIDLETFKLNQNSSETLVAGCVRLDGLCIFEILDRKPNLSQRIKFTEKRLKDIGQTYFQTDDKELKVFSEAQANQQTIYVAVGERQLPVLTLNNQDALRRGVFLNHEAEKVASQIEQGLIRAKQQRQKPYLIQQVRIAVIVAIAMLLGYFLNMRWLRRAKGLKTQLKEPQEATNLSFELRQQKKINLQEIKYRLLQSMQGAIGVGGTIIILGLFPYTHTAQLWIITLIRIPLRIILVSLATYILIRLSYALIDRLNAALNSEQLDRNYVFSPEINRRLRIRINTIARLLRGIITCFWIGVGVIVALSVVGINVTPLLAGAGILGLAFSFASQSLIKDTLNGFFIILEDQYAVGDVVTIGNTGGMVENLNLRITQLRNAEGSLITLANSQINSVENHSNGWSRSDLRIPVAYETSIDLAIAVVSQVALEVSEDEAWRNQVIEPPQILGVEDFSEYGVVIRVWFKTEPLKQWDVAREFRRRIKIAFEAAEIPLSLAQQKIWFRDFEPDLLAHNLKINDQQSAINE
ncbi:MAG: mechanosensitive ion channel family protein [Cyanobacteria bacterium J06555_3]